MLDLSEIVRKSRSKVGKIVERGSLIHSDARYVGLGVEREGGGRCAEDLRVDCC